MSDFDVLETLEESRRMRSLTNEELVAECAQAHAARRAEYAQNPETAESRRRLDAIYARVFMTNEDGTKYLHPDLRKAICTDAFCAADEGLAEDVEPFRCGPCKKLWLKYYRARLAEPL